jgi:hypothetical protein
MRRLAIIAAAALAIGLSACDNGPSIAEAEQTAQEFCAEHGGVQEVEYFKSDWPRASSFDVYCRDGSEIE